MKKSLIYLSIIITTTLLSVVSGSVDWMFQIAVTLILFFFSACYIKNKFKNGIALKIVGLAIPFVLLYGYGIIISSQQYIMKLRVLPILIAPLAGVFFALVLKSNYKNLIIYSAFSLIIGYIFMPNWIEFITDTENPINEKFPNLTIKDIEDNPFNLPNDKTIILDLWSSNCGICIKKFPEFEELKNNYKENKKLVFYTLNLPLKRDSLRDMTTIVDNYEFESLFAQNLDSWQKLNNTTVPKILIINESNKIVYKGNLNNKWYMFYNNINNLIKNTID